MTLDKVLRGLVTLAVLPLPAPRRPRYSEEFLFELLALRRRQRLGHALRLLASAWELRGALTEAMRTQMPGDAVEPPGVTDEESSADLANDLANKSDEQAFVGLVNDFNRGPWRKVSKPRPPVR